MATSPLFGWEEPDDTDLVKDGAAAIRTLGNAIDTSMGDLLGGTTGQVLSKASNTNMDFSWVTSDDANAIQNAIVDAKGDLIAATANDTPARLAVGNNGETLVADSSTATGLKWAAPATGMSNPMTTTGDTIYSSSGSTPARLGIGSTGQVLTVAAGIPSWATPSGGSMTQLATGTMSGNSVSLSSISGSYKNLKLILRDLTFNNAAKPYITFNGTGGLSCYNSFNSNGTGNSFWNEDFIYLVGTLTGRITTTGADNNFNIDIFDYANSVSGKTFAFQGFFNQLDSGVSGSSGAGGASYSTTAINNIRITNAEGYTFTGGTYILYGVN